MYFLEKILCNDERKMNEFVKIFLKVPQNVTRKAFGVIKAVTEYQNSKPKMMATSFEKKCRLSEKLIHTHTNSFISPILQRPLFEVLGFISSLPFF